MNRFLSRMAAAGLGLALGASAASAAETRPNLSGFWEPRAGSMRPLAPPAFTAEARERMKPPEGNSREAILARNGIDETDVNCLPAAQPWILTQSAPIDIVQEAGEVLVVTENRSLPWRIYTDGRGHPEVGPQNRSLNGHSIGRWEGDTLVVDTVGFADRPGHGPYGDLPHNPTLHVVQRFRLEKGGGELHARFTIEDPRLFSEPYVYDFVWYRDPPDTYASVAVCDARDPANGRY